MKGFLKKSLMGLLVILSLSGGANAYAKHHHHHRSVTRSMVADYRSHRRNVSVPDTKSSHRVAGIEGVGLIIGQRPITCYGIAWCGCWMRTQVSHDPGSSYNLAANWANFGHSATLQPGSIVVKAHHVERVERVLGDNTYIAAAGNTGHGNNATTYLSSLKGAIAIRSE